MKPIGALIFAAVAFAAPFAAVAQPHHVHPPPPTPPPAPAAYNSCEPGYSAPSQTQAAYDCSGTIGRVGLGASPFHPEGPGNVTFSR